MPNLKNMPCKIFLFFMTRYETNNYFQGKYFVKLYRNEIHLVSRNPTEYLAFGTVLIRTSDLVYIFSN